MDGGSDPWWRFWAWVVFVLAAVTDGIDGTIARQRGEITNFGKVADPIADKALTGTAFIGLSVLGVVWWWVTVVILVREIGITVLRFVVIRHGVMPAGRGGKLKTMLQTLVARRPDLPLWPCCPLGGAWLFVAYVLLAAALVMTVVSGVDYVFKAPRLRETSERTRLRRAQARPPGRPARRAPRAGGRRRRSTSVRRTRRRGAPRSGRRGPALPETTACRTGRRDARVDAADH